MYIPHYYPHDTRIILNMHKWGNKLLNKNCQLTQAPIRQGPTLRSGHNQNLFLCLSFFGHF